MASVTSLSHRLSRPHRGSHRGDFCRTTSTPDIGTTSSKLACPPTLRGGEPHAARAAHGA
eukprot:758044-Hanusia_phi.AAC.4